MRRSPPQSRPREKKQFRVHTMTKPYKWLHALDPLARGRASFIRSEWRDKVADATIFGSNMYATQVAENNPGKWGFTVERAP